MENFYSKVLTVKQFRSIVPKHLANKTGNLRIAKEDCKKYSEIVESLRVSPENSISLLWGIRLVLCDASLPLSKDNVVRIDDGALRSLVLLTIDKHLSPDQFKALETLKIVVFCESSMGSKDEIINRTVLANSSRPIRSIQRSSLNSGLIFLIDLLEFEGTLKPINLKDDTAVTTAATSYLIKTLFAFFSPGWTYSHAMKQATSADWKTVMGGYSAKDVTNAITFIKLCQLKIEGLPKQKGTPMAGAVNDFQLKIADGLMSCIMFSAGRAYTGQTAAALYNSLEVQDTLTYLKRTLGVLKQDVTSTCRLFMHDRTNQPRSTAKAAKKKEE